MLPNQNLWTKKEITLNPAREHTRVIKANSFVDALRPLYDYMSILRGQTVTIDARADEMASIVNGFWGALKGTYTRRVRGSSRVCVVQVGRRRSHAPSAP